MQITSSSLFEAQLYLQMGRNPLCRAFLREMGAVFALLLCQLTNLKTRSLRGAFWVDSKIMGIVFEGK